MEQDKKLQDILRQSADGASLHFTGTVMNRVQRSALPSQYQPMVNSRIRKAFIFVFTAITVSIFLVSVIIAFAGYHFTGWPAVSLFLAYVYENYYPIIAFIITFWFVLITNSLIEKKLLQRKASGYKAG